MSNILCIFLVLFLNFPLHLTYGQYIETEIPPIACPEYFQYVSLSRTLVGKLTLPRVEIGSTTVEAHFSQWDPVESRYFGSLKIFQEEDMDGEKLISFRVDFPRIDVLPKLTRIVVNGEVICSAPGYPPPGISFKMQNTYRATIQTVGVPFSYRTVNAALPAYRRQFNVNKPIQKDSEINEYLKSVCGQSGTENSKFDPFIHGGTVLQPGEYPWLSAIFKHKTKFICGGSLISTTTILTAAHCFEEPGLTAEHLTVYLGRYNFSDVMEKDFLQREINTMVIHPDYRTGNSFPDADVALLQMLQPVSFTRLIRPICLWNEPTDQSLIVGIPGIVAGWGVTDFNKTLSLVPQKVEQDIVSDVECLRSSPAFYSLTSQRTLCAGKRDGTGPCHGDSGGGLIFNRNGRWVLRAVVSAGQTTQGECNLGEYVVYCDIAKHLKWVLSSMLT